MFVVNRPPPLLRPLKTRTSSSTASWWSAPRTAHCHSHRRRPPRRRRQHRHRQLTTPHPIIMAWRSPPACSLCPSARPSSCNSSSAAITTPSSPSKTAAATASTATTTTCQPRFSTSKRSFTSGHRLRGRAAAACSRSSSATP